MDDDYYDDEDDLEEVARKKAHVKEVTGRIVAQVSGWGVYCCDFLLLSFAFYCP